MGVGAATASPSLVTSSDNSLVLPPKNAKSGKGKFCWHLSVVPKLCDSLDDPQEAKYTLNYAETFNYKSLLSYSHIW